MSGLGGWLWGTSQLDDAVDKATSELLPSGGEDIALNLEICDQIRSKSVPAKDAMRALKRRLNHKNPNVQLLALSLTDICIKNGGDHLLTEVASREFMDNLVSILKIPALNIDVKNTILRLIQNWSIAFEGKYSLSYVGQVYKTLINEGYKFPPKDLVVANSAMVDTQTAPEWIDSDVCLRCRTSFSFTNRKHHCRNCGQVFDQQCSSKTLPLPHFGITQEVRVCDGCHSKLTKKADKIDKSQRSAHSGIRHRSVREQTDTDLQRAIQLSLQEISANGNNQSGYVASQPSPSKWQYSEPPIVDSSHRNKRVDDDVDDPDLKAAIEASLREASAPRPSAPAALEIPRTEAASFYNGPQFSQQPGIAPSHPSLPRLPNYDLAPLESDAILTFNQMIDQVQAQGGRDLSRYPAVAELYDKANSLRPKLALNLDDAGRKEDMLADMHDKLSQAVKLYDQILSQQVAQPRWRSQPVVLPPVTQQSVTQEIVPGPNASYAGHQWAPARSTSAIYSQQVAHNTPALAQNQNQQSPYANSSESSVSQWPSQVQSQRRQSYNDRQPQYSQHMQTPVLASPYQTPSNYAQQPPQMQYNSPSPNSSQAFPPHAMSFMVPHPSSIPSTQSTPLTRGPPTLQPSSPPTHFTPHDLRTSPSLTRHNTISYTASSQTPAGANLTRSNTVNVQPQAYQQQLTTPASPPPVPVSSPLPQFPVAPTAAPQSFAMFGHPAPTGFEQKEERKEALLIDL